MQLNKMEAHRSVMASHNCRKLKTVGGLVEVLQHRTGLHGTGKQLLENCARDRVGLKLKSVQKNTARQSNKKKKETKADLLYMS